MENQMYYPCNHEDTKKMYVCIRASCGWDESNFQGTESSLELERTRVSLLPWLARYMEELWITTWWTITRKLAPIGAKTTASWNATSIGTSWRAVDETSYSITNCKREMQHSDINCIPSFLLTQQAQADMSFLTELLIRDWQKNTNKSKSKTQKCMLSGVISKTKC